MIKINWKSLVLSLILGLITAILLPIWLGVGAAPLNKLFDDIMKKRFGESTIGPVIIWFSISIVLYLLYFVGKVLFSKAGQLSTSEQRKLLLEQLALGYQSRLNQKLANDVTFEINLSLRFANQLVETPAKPIRKFTLDGFDNQQVGSFDELFNLYTTNIRRLAIVGEAGAGKTVLLLKFALRLVKLAQDNASAPIPILLDLATWQHAKYTDKFEPVAMSKSFKNWLESSGAKKLQEMGVPRNQAFSLLSSYQVLPLLDGLDEIPDTQFDHQVAERLQAMHEYFDERKHRLGIEFPELLLSSRAKQYIDAQYSGYINPIHAIISVDPVKNLVAELQNLAKNDPAGTASSLLANLNQFPALVPILSTAFNIHIALRLTRAEFDFSQIHTDQDLLNAYIYFHLNQVETDYPAETSINALSWFARHSKELRFSALSINSNAFENKLGYYLLKALCLIPLAVIIGLCSYLIAQPLISIARPGVSPLIWLGLSTFFILIASFDTTSGLESSYGIQFNVKKTIRQLIIKSLITTGCIILSCIVFTKISAVYGLVVLMLGAGYMLKKEAPSIIRSKNISSVWSLFIARTLFFILDAICWVCLFLLTSALMHTALNLGLTRPLTQQHFTYTAVENITSHLPRILLISVLLGFAAETPSSFVSDHYVSKMLLRLSATIPKKSDQFLKKMLHLGFIESVDGAYRFRHILIQQWFIKKTGHDDFNLKLVTNDDQFLGVTEAEDN